MPTVVTCPNCGRRGKLPDTYIKPTVTCPGCQMAFEVAVWSTPTTDVPIQAPKPLAPPGRRRSLGVPGILTAFLIVTVGAVAVGMRGRAPGKPPAPVPVATPEVVPPDELVLRRFIYASSWEEIGRVVRKPEQSVPRMFDHYRGSLPRFGVIGPATRISNISVFRMVAGTDAIGAFWMVREPTGWKVDWEASLPWNPITIRMYSIERPRGRTILRAMCEIDNYYNYAYQHGRDRYYSLRLTDGTGTIHGYIGREQNDAQRLVKILADGERHPIMIELETLGEEGDCYSAIRVVSFLWVEP